MYYPNQIFRSAIFSILVVLALIAWPLWPKHGTATSSGSAAPEVTGEHWINSKPLTIAQLRDRVVLVEFWTYG
jgi:hypothetical protein